MLYSSFKDFIVCFLKPLNGLAPYNLSELLSWRSHQMLVFVHTSRLKPRLHLSFTNLPLQIRTSQHSTSLKPARRHVFTRLNINKILTLHFCFVYFSSYFFCIWCQPLFFINVPITPPPNWLLRRGGYCQNASPSQTAFWISPQW